MSLDLDRCISDLKDCKFLEESLFWEICVLARDLFIDEGNVLEV